MTHLKKNKTRVTGSLVGFSVEDPTSLGCMHSFWAKLPRGGLRESTEKHLPLGGWGVRGASACFRRARFSVPRCPNSAKATPQSGPCSIPFGSFARRHRLGCIPVNLVNGETPCQTEHMGMKFDLVTLSWTFWKGFTSTNPFPADPTRNQYEVQTEFSRLSHVSETRRHLPKKIMGMWCLLWQARAGHPN